MWTPRIPHLLSAADTAWLHMDQPTNLMVVGSLAVLDAPVDAVKLERIVSTRLIPNHPRFRQRIRSAVLPLQFWDDDPTFDVRDHIHHVALPAPGDADSLRELVGDLMSTPLDMTRSPWDMHIIEGYSGAACVIFSRVHHCLGDGTALVKALFDMTGGARGRHATNTRRGRKPQARMPFTLQPLNAVQSVWTLARLIALLPDSSNPLRGELHRRKRIAWTEPVAFSDLHATSKHHDSTVNDVVLAAISGALAAYLHKRRSAPRRIRALVPVDVRDSPSAHSSGNYFGLVFLELPTEISGSVSRLRAVRQRMNKAKNSPEPQVTFEVLEALGLMPASVQRLVARFFGTKASLVVTNVRGPDRPISIAGSQIRTHAFFVPQSAQLGLGISIYSYRGEVSIGVIGDGILVDDPQSLAQGIERELSRLMIKGRPGARRPSPRSRTLAAS